MHLDPFISKADTVASTPEELDFKDGISLLSLKNDALISYIHSMVLMSCHRIAGHSLLDREPPSQGFASLDRDPRGSNAGDLVDHAIEARAILEKSKALEARMKYQIEKLVRLAESSTAIEGDIGEGKCTYIPFPLLRWIPPFHASVLSC